jgi:RNA polymerase sigma-70 factor (ECF subfamily)
MGDTVDDDAALVQRCLSGDADALRAFVERFQSLVFSLCFRMLGNQHDAEDVTQEAMTRAVRHLGHWDSARPLRPWLMMIAANRCRTALERRSRRPLTVDDSQSWPAVTHCTPDLGEELQHCIEELRPDYRTCFLLFYQQELSIEDIAEAMDCPQGTVKTWLYRARRELAEKLKQRGVTDEDGYELRDF